METSYQKRMIEWIAKERHIPWLVHFTLIDNLEGIVEHGLLPRETLKKRGYTFRPSGPCLSDECEVAVSVSISTVNAVFETKRNNNGRADWVVLYLQRDILWTHKCLFTWRNAARNEIKYPIFERDGRWAFSKMFEGSDEKRNGRPLWCPTDPEAEVQVLEPIERDCILGVVVYRPELVEPVQRLFEDLPGEQWLEVVDGF